MDIINHLGYTENREVIFKSFRMFLLIFLLHACNDISKQHPIDISKNQSDFFFIRDQLILSEISYICLESNEIPSTREWEKVKEKMNLLNIDCVYISNNDSTVQYSSNVLAKKITYIYDFSEWGNKLIEYNEPNSSSFLRKIENRWYYQETGFD